MKNMRFSIMLYLVAMQFILFSFSGSAMAASVEWALNDVVFDDGASASGTFTYDADTDIYSNWAISITDSSNQTLPDFTYQPTNAYPGDPWIGEVLSLSTSTWVRFVCPSALPYNSLGRYLQLVFSTGATGLTNAGGTINLVLDELSFEQAPNWAGAPEVIRYITGGSVSSVPQSTVPIPAAAWLLGSGLIGLIGIKRKFRT